MKNLNEQSSLRKYSLEELKRMPKSKVIWLDILQLPLHEKTLNYFYNNNNSKRSERDLLEKFGESSLQTNLHYFLSNPNFFNSCYDPKSFNRKKGVSRMVDIKNLIENLGMKIGRLSTFADSKSKSKILDLFVSSYCRYALVVTISHLANLDYSKLRYFTFKEVLDLDIKMGDNFRYRNKYRTLLKVRDFFITYGFKLGEYPFLNKEFWNQIENEAKEKEKKQNLQQTLFDLKKIVKENGLNVSNYQFLETKFWIEEFINK